jgi:hypothetical protein
LTSAGNATECPFTQVNDAAWKVRPVIVDPDRHRAAILLICHSNFCPKWQAAMGGSEGLGIKTLAAGSQIAVEAWAIPTRNSARRSSLHCKWRKGTKSKGSGKDKTKHLLRESKE